MYIYTKPHNQQQMENPCLTFATPTLLAGDRSLADVIAHEIAVGALVWYCCCWLGASLLVCARAKLIGGGVVWFDGWLGDGNVGRQSVDLSTNQHAPLPTMTPSVPYICTQHSWSGNLVTNHTWEHFWLNEGCVRGFK